MTTNKGKHSFRISTDTIPYTTRYILATELEKGDIIAMRAIWDYDVEQLYYVKSKNIKTISLLECDEYGNTGEIHPSGLYKIKSQLYPYNNTSEFRLVIKNKREI